MAGLHINSLPEEILLNILELLDSPAPSQLNSRKEPSLQITSSTHQDYKNISKVSKRWRRVTLPLLFKHSRLIISNMILKSSSTEANSSQQPSSGGAEETSSEVDETLLHGQYPSIEQEDRTIHANDGVSTAVEAYLTFVHTHNLTSSIQTFALLIHSSNTRPTDNIAPGGDSSRGRYPHLSRSFASAYVTSALFWRRIFHSINPIRVIVTASPLHLACLTNCAIDLFGDWAFSDMEYHILELGVSDAVTVASASSPSGLDMHHDTSMREEDYIPTTYPGIASSSSSPPSSLLYLKPWDEIHLNEGSFLRAYATYEFFERGPPSLIASIKSCLLSLPPPPSSSSSSSDHSHQPRRSSSVKKFVYTAILPFATHTDLFRGLLPHVEELDVKLAPDCDSGILNDKNRVGKAQLEGMVSSLPISHSSFPTNQIISSIDRLTQVYYPDCWQEFFSSYEVISNPFRSPSILRQSTSGNSGPTIKLQKFICRDYQNPALAEDLDELFTWLCMPCWAEMQRGVFQRQVVVEEYPWA